MYGFVVCVCVCVKVNGMRGFGNNKLPYSDQPDPLGNEVDECFCECACVM